ncbi:protein eva-1 homolog C-like [Bombina bombina]|uniref:protein eva-1 homolog C-like n=1 Tax=Bombina bombina TaxID=8345 RepID=UPI00235A82A1|nr:protein eva-1 homolog C-like [Bombina bombina]
MMLPLQVATFKFPYSFWITLILSFLPTSTATAPEFSGYLHKVLKSHTSHACDGDLITVTCPHKTSISILSAFYGRRISSQNLCPSVLEKSEENMFCSSPTALQKLYDECQDHRSCQLLVNSRIFGSDPCPDTNKYLLVSYKCKPDNYKVRRVCEDEQLNLVCRNNSLLSIYSATYGRALHGNPECASKNKTSPEYECYAQTSLRKVFRRCHRRHNCTIIADTRTFGDPCFPGTMKHLTVSYTCVPRRLLEEIGSSSTDPFSLSDSTHGGWYTGPRLSMLSEDAMILTDSLEVFAMVQDVPEKLALYFLCGVSAGLVFLLCIFTPKIIFLQDIKKAFWEPQSNDEPVLGGIKMVVRRVDENREHDDSSSESSFRRLSHSYRFSNNIFSPDVTAAFEGTTEDKGQGTDEIWLPKEASPYAIQKIKETSE